MLDRTAAGVLAALLVATVPARAFDTRIEPGTSPIQLDGCTAYTQKLYRTNRGRLVAPGHKAVLEHYVAPAWVTHLGAAFRNTGHRTATAVAVHYIVRDAEDQPRATYDAVWRGHFHPHAGYDYNAQGFQIAQIVHVPVRTIECRVSLVEYAR